MVLWRRLGAVTASELHLERTFTNGQAFGWRSDASRVEWRGVVSDAVVALRQDFSKGAEGQVLYACLNQDDRDVRAELSDLFQLDVPLAPLLAEWCRGDSRHVLQRFAGMRILRQDPVECLFSFIASSNNNIGRITKMMLELRRKCGALLLSAAPPPDPAAAARPAAAASPSRLLPYPPPSPGGAAAALAGGGVCDAYHAFPTLAQLAAVPEEQLRALGFGYRAKFFVRTTAQLHELGGVVWLRALRLQQDPRAVQAALCQLHGVGPKVADCVALFSLDQAGCIPVDTHVWQIAVRDFDASLGDAKSLTPAVYARVGDLFRSRFGARAGWAHSYLFANELPSVAAAAKAAKAAAGSPAGDELSAAAGGAPPQARGAAGGKRAASSAAGGGKPKKVKSGLDFSIVSGASL
jgi:N-glycosylase/DNA lyase